MNTKYFFINKLKQNNFRNKCTKVNLVFKRNEIIYINYPLR